MRLFNKTELIVIKILKNNYELADNFRKVYVEYISGLGFDFDAEIYIAGPGVSDATINKALEIVLKELVEEDGWAYRKLGFPVEAYRFFRKIRYIGKKQEKECKDRVVVATPKQIGNLKRSDAESNNQQESMFKPQPYGYTHKDNSTGSS